jgi:transposase
MSYITGASREQFMLPTSIDEYVWFDNIVRFIDAFVDKVITNDTLLSFTWKGSSDDGRPAYHPRSLTKLLIYGYLNSVSSSRGLERETRRNLEVIWLMQGQRPKYWTISNFRKDNKALIKKITIDFRRFLKDSDYIKGESLSTDGTKIKANASRSILSIKLIDKKVSRIEEDIERYLSQLSKNDAMEEQHAEMLAANDALKSQITRLEKQLQELESQKQLLEMTDRETLAPADYDARIMKTKDGFLPAYNVQGTVCNDSHLIVSCIATTNPNDYHSLEENITTSVKEVGIVPKTILADSGYANEEQIQSLEQQKIDCFVPFPDEPESKKIQRQKGITFVYDEQANCFHCSQGKQLVSVQKNLKRKNRICNKYQCKECHNCPVREHCTTSKTGRIIYRRVDGEWLVNYKQRTRTKEFKEKYKERKNTIEHLFGTMRYYMGQIPLLLRGVENVQTEIDLYATACNLKRSKNIAGVLELLEKLAKWDPIGGFLHFFSTFTHFRLVQNRKICFAMYKKEVAT